MFGCPTWLQSFLSCAPDWEVHGPFAKAAAAAITELICLAPTADQLHAGSDQLLQLIHRWEGPHGYELLSSHSQMAAIMRCPCWHV